MIPGLAPTTEEALHHIAGGQLHCCLPRVRGQSGISTIGKEKPHGFQVVICYCIMDRPARAEAERGWEFAEEMLFELRSLEC